MVILLSLLLTGLASAAPLTCEQISGVVGVFQSAHVLSRDAQLRDRVLSNQALIENLRVHFPKALDKGWGVFLLSEIEFLSRPSVDLNREIFQESNCRSVDALYALYRKALQRSLDVLPPDRLMSGAERSTILGLMKKVAAQRLLETRAADIRDLPYAVSEADLVDVLETRLALKALAAVEGDGHSVTMSWPEAIEQVLAQFQAFRLGIVKKEDMPTLVTHFMISSVDPDSGYFAEAAVTPTRSSPGNMNLPRELATSVQDMGAGAVGFMQIQNFNGGTAEAVERAVEGFVANSNVRGILIDLRNAGGANLPDAVSVMQIFDDRSPRVGLYSLSVENQDPQIFALDDNPRRFTGLVMILVNEKTWGAAEAFAGAMQSYGRALIVGGGPTRGLGSRVISGPLESYKSNFRNLFNQETRMAMWFRPTPPGILRVTTAFYYLPNGEPIQGVGIRPDILTELGSAADGRAFFQKKGRRVSALPFLQGSEDPHYKSDLEAVRAYARDLLPFRNVGKEFVSTLLKKSAQMTRVTPTEDFEKTISVLILSNYSHVSSVRSAFNIPQIEFH